MAEIADVRSLGDEIRGEVVLAEDASWDGARQAYNLAVDQRPQLVALPADADDVARVVSFARERGLRVAPQRTGHNAEPLGPLDGIVLVNTKLMQGVEIDADARTCRVAAGAIWSDVVPDASDLGLAALHGSSPNVSIAGYTLGGGLGFYARKLGLATNSVRAIELVNADGDLVRADADNEEELFWALRGGGGNFGVVTALEFDLFPIERIYAGALFFDFERSAEALHAWREWIETVPDEVTSVGRMMQFPPLPELPDAAAGQVVRRSSRRSRSAPRRRPRGCWLPSATSARRWTRSGWSRPPRSRSSTWIRPTRFPTTAATACWSPSCRRRRSTPSSRRAGPDRTRR